MINRIKSNIILIGIVILCILVIVINITWIKNTIITTLGGYINKETITITKESYTKGKIDTLSVFNHYVETRGIILNPEPIIEYRYINPIKGKEVEEDSIKNYSVKITDSLIDGVLSINNNFKGDLLYSKLKYKPLFPKYITRIDTLRITNNTTTILDNKKSLLGIGVGYNSLQYPSILGSYISKTKWQFIYEYGKPLEETKLIINDGGAFTTSSRDFHSFKIIKHF